MKQVLIVRYRKNKKIVDVKVSINSAQNVLKEKRKIDSCAELIMLENGVEYCLC